jgi:hypothetical protein
MRPNNEPNDIRPAPPNWRHLIPAWLRALIWTDQSPRYDGFISYSCQSDRPIAPRVQSIISQGHSELELIALFDSEGVSR